MPPESERFAEFLEFTPQACLIVDAGVVKAANEAALDTTGIPLGRLVGVPFGDLLVPEFEREWRELILGARTTLNTARVRLASGLVPLELTARSIGDDVVAVGLRSMTTEHHYSALAGGDLTHDPVTGFPNRYHLLAQLHQRMTTPRHHPLALIGLWIDELPHLTETRGQRATERIVSEVAKRIQARLRTPDMLGRYDDAGFLGLLTSDAPIDQLKTIAERLRGEVAFPVEFDDNLVSFTASVAVASVNGRRPSIERALAQLEAAANRAATGNGNRTEILDL